MSSTSFILSPSSNVIYVFHPLSVFQCHLRLSSSLRLPMSSTSLSVFQCHLSLSSSLRLPMSSKSFILSPSSNVIYVSHPLSVFQCLLCLSSSLNLQTASQLASFGICEIICRRLKPMAELHQNILKVTRLSQEYPVWMIPFFYFNRGLCKYIILADWAPCALNLLRTGIIHVGTSETLQHT